MRKSTALRAVALIMLLTLSLSLLVGCKSAVTQDEAKATINEFMEALRVEDYEKASSLMHPLNEGENLQDFCDALRNIGIDLTQGVTDKKQTNFTSSLYNSEYKGSGYQIVFDAKVGESDVTIQATVVRNSDGYGVYQFLVSPKQ